MRAALCLAAIMSAVPGAAETARWVMVAPMDDDRRYIDADAIVRDGPNVTIWLKTHMASPGKRGEAVAVEKWIHDCDNGRAKLLAMTLYKANGSVVSSAELPRYRLDWTNLTPSSANWAVHDVVCGVTAIDAGEEDPTKSDDAVT